MSRSIAPGQLDDAALAALDAEVGLPLSLRAASALDLSPDSELRALLVPQSDSRRSPLHLSRHNVLDDNFLERSRGS